MSFSCCLSPSSTSFPPPFPVHCPPSLIYRKRFWSTSQGEDHKIHITHIQFCIAHNYIFGNAHGLRTSEPRVVYWIHKVKVIKWHCFEKVNNNIKYVSHNSHRGISPYFIHWEQIDFILEWHWRENFTTKRYIGERLIFIKLHLFAIHRDNNKQKCVQCSMCWFGCKRNVHISL